MLNDLRFGLAYLGAVWIAAAGLVVSGVAWVVVRRPGDHRRSIFDRVGLIWLIAALTAVLVLTLQPGPGGIGAPLPSIPNPLSRVRPPDAIATVALYVPVGFFATVVWRSRARPILWATVLAFSLTLMVELVQWVLPISRSAESHDVIFNTVGGLLGALVGCAVVRLSRRAEQPVLRSSGNG